MNKNLLLALPLLAMLAACDTSSSDTPKPQIGGREETKGIRNTREIGVSGDAIADHVDKALDGNVTWKDGDVNGATRMVIAATGDRIVAVKGECYYGNDAAAKDVASCVQALGTLDVGIAVADRVGLTVPAAPAPVAPSLSTPGLTGEHVTMPPMTVKQETPGPDRRPVYAGAGLIVIAAIFWWNRRRRQST